MRRFAVPTPSWRWSASQRRARRGMRLAPRCEYLESRQLLSIGQTGPAAGVLASRSVPVAQAPSPPAASSVGVSSDSSSAAKFGTPGGLNDGQVGFLLNEFAALVDSATPSVAILATLAANPTSDEIEVNLALTNFSVTVLNPVDTSVAAAITDTQVDADAYLVPSTTELLEGYLGVPTALPSQVGFMFSDLLGAGTAPDVTTTNAHSTVISNADTPGSSVTHLGRNLVSTRGQSAPQELSVYPQSSPPDDEPLELGAPAEAPPVQPAPPDGQAPAPGNAPQPAPPGGQTPAPEQAPQPAPPAGHAPAPGAAPEAVPPGEKAPAPETAPARPLPPSSDAAIDAALDLTDARVFTRSRDRDASQPDDPLPRIDTSRSLSVVFAASVVASGGYHWAMRTADRSRSQGRLVPRWLGAERPTRQKIATPFR
jgi:hypothetical protein